MVIIKCRYCINNFLTEIVKNKPRNKFCSRVCYWKYKKDDVSIHGSGNPCWKGGLIKKKCEICQKEFFARRDLIKIKGGRFCSRACYGRWSSKVRVGKNHPRYKEKILKSCCQCNKKYSVIFSRNKSKFCSTKCSGIWQGKHARGENGRAWNGGITSVYDRLKTCLKYYQWRNNIYKKDGYTCRVCGDDLRHNLNAHHMHPFEFSKILHYLKDRFGIKNLYESAINYEPLWSLEIGVVLCKKCHKTTSSYGKKLKINKLYQKTRSKSGDEKKE